MDCAKGEVTEALSSNWKAAPELKEKHRGEPRPLLALADAPDGQMANNALNHSIWSLAPTSQQTMFSNGPEMLPWKNDVKRALLQHEVTKNLAQYAGDFKPSKQTPTHGTGSTMAPDDVDDGAHSLVGDIDEPELETQGANSLVGDDDDFVPGSDLQGAHSLVGDSDEPELEIESEGANSLVGDDDDFVPGSDLQELDDGPKPTPTLREVECEERPFDPELLGIPPSRPTSGANTPRDVEDDGAIGLRPGGVVFGCLAAMFHGSLAADF